MSLSFFARFPLSCSTELVAKILQSVVKVVLGVVIEEGRPNLADVHGQDVLVLQLDILRAHLLFLHELDQLIV